MPLLVQTVKDRVQDQIAPEDDDKFLKLLTEADERLLNMGRWRWTRTVLLLTPDSDKLISLPSDYESIVGCRLGEVASGVAWQELEFMEGGPGLINIEGCGGRLIDQGLVEVGEDSDSELVRQYKVSDVAITEVSLLVRYASKTYDDLTGLTLCPSVAALKQMMLSIIFEQGDNTKLSLEYQQKARLTLDEQEAAYRGIAKQVFRPSMTIPLRRRSRTNFP
jgi:hypothetical protein